MRNTSGVNSLITRGSFFVVDCGDAGSRLIDFYSFAEMQVRGRALEEPSRALKTSELQG